MFSCCAKVVLSSLFLDVSIFIDPAGISDVSKTWYNDVAINDVFSDGELQEGQIWEALQVSVYYKLDNLWAIVDVNEQQVDGAMSDVLDIGNIQKKINSFGAKCIEIDGHDIEAMRQAKNEKHKDHPYNSCKNSHLTKVWTI